MEDGRILDEQIHASTHRYKFRPEFARLNNKRNRATRTWGAWCADEDDRNIYLEVGLHAWFLSTEIKICSHDPVLLKFTLIVMELYLRLSSVHIT